MIRVGTSGYNYPEWKGLFYPEDLPASKMLPYYAERFSTVEINASFYRMPTPKTVAGWAAATPASFTFVLKAPQRITHFARLRNIDEPLRFFCDAAESLGPKRGPLFFQLPPNFKKDTERLAQTLALLPPGVDAAFEFRHASWFADDVYDILRARNAALAIVDNNTVDGHGRQGSMAGATPAVATADWGYLRLRAAHYADDDLRRWVATIREVGVRWRQGFVFFKHEDAGAGPVLARRLRDLLEA
ncbi:MAG: DUF72 domain-containing protein [Candidatus Rokubacteria bacterium]|nr:DUF72 domain-containing protein [Candidatus Rokubacteria bacterium]